MTFLLGAAAVLACGAALLRLLRLETGRPGVDLPLAWFAGGAWVGLCGLLAQGVLGAPPGVATAVALALPPAAWAARARWGGPGRAATSPAPASAPPAARWLPRPAWLFAPLAAWTLAVAVAASLHALATPVFTEDSYRVRAFAPILAATGARGEAALGVLTVAGPVPAYLPAVAWSLGGAIDPVDVGATVVITFWAFLALLVGLGATRGRPEAGWGAAFAVASMPLFAYHAASTYADAWLGMALGAAFAFLVALGRDGDPADLGRAALLLLAAAMTKREGELLALPVAALALAQAAWTGRAAAGAALRRLAAFGAAWLLLLLARVRLAGLEGASPFLHALAGRLAGGAPGGAPAAASAAAGESAGQVLLRALFTDGDLGLLAWVVVAALVLLPGEVRRARLGWSLAALGVLLLEVAVSAVWVYPAFTLDHTTVHRSLLPVGAAAAVWVAALLAAACAGEGRPRARARA